MAEKKTKVVKKAVPKKVAPSELKPREHGDVKVDVYSPDGSKSGTLTLPETVFAAKVNRPLMAQAVRVYLANQRTQSASSKTRGEVDGSSRKIYKQKGTGRARHGSIRAGIFVKGGVTLGPKPHSFTLDLPKKMKKAAVTSALTEKLMQDRVRVVADMGGLELKTKVYDSMFDALATTRKTLVLVSKEENSLTRAMGNLAYIDVLEAGYTFTYAVVHHRHIVITKNAVKELETLYK